MSYSRHVDISDSVRLAVPELVAENWSILEQVLQVGSGPAVRVRIQAPRAELARFKDRSYLWFSQLPAETPVTPETVRRIALPQAAVALIQRAGGKLPPPSYGPPIRVEMPDRISQQRSRIDLTELSLGALIHVREGRNRVDPGPVTPEMLAPFAIRDLGMMARRIDPVPLAAVFPDTPLGAAVVAEPPLFAPVAGMRVGAAAFLKLVGETGALPRSITIEPADPVPPGESITLAFVLDPDIGNWTVTHHMPRATAISAEVFCLKGRIYAELFHDTQRETDSLGDGTRSASNPSLPLDASAINTAHNLILTVTGKDYNGNSGYWGRWITTYGGDTPL